MVTFDAIYSGGKGRIFYCKIKALLTTGASDKSYLTQLASQSTGYGFLKSTLKIEP